MRKGSDDLAHLLNHGTRMALVYGDRDRNWRRNWLGAENLTLSLPWPSVRSPRFPSSG
ncbi:hypothetical protein DPSP01_007267 [Paraphaeosphaeria sporulosa]